ncbi:hypothetical protein MARA_54160 [Mycolicibacterium arabiense]|uniref:Integral membrane protein n=1 Tax=Mycolicibacterium arabiense TaxID=1286181 RepID=A0A7I7S527_9MYCO|nr:hypothetical protein [Mycolicibacterium arabiense]MCV7372875.1 hypothetical protein [Mycolicibacterium arabiense]BBY51948.1 hypothetical protein MARA_54160 [Mycolicibacterium arabiense]
MTATTSHPATTTAKDSLLRFALRLDAIASGVIGVAGLALAPRIAEWSGTTAAFEYSLSAFFVVYGVAVFALSRMRTVRTWGVLIAIGNVVFTVAAVALVLADVMPLTTTGVVLTLASGVFTLAMADLQYLGLRRLR